MRYLAASCLAVACSLSAQVAYPNLEVHIDNLPALTARSKDPFDVLRTSVEIVLRGRDVCCGKDSALGDSLERADPTSLKDIADRLQGRHLLSDGRPILVKAQYIAPDAIGAEGLINTLHAKHALLLEWNSHMYVCYGVTYRRDYAANGGVRDTILTFLLLDPRYSGSRREVVFNRDIDDWSKVQGVLSVESALQ